MNDRPSETNQNTEDHQKLLADLSTVLVDVFGGIVQNVKAEEDLHQPVRVVVRDHDNLKVDPDSPDYEWLLGEDTGLRSTSYVTGFKDGFIAALRDENFGPGHTWTEKEQADLFEEIDRWFG
ncbi:MAG: hypothetical protein KJ621_18965 [Proteobacteria bacterium]|nr:hypothetical protein [Pseudomonadota bacterium]